MDLGNYEIALIGIGGTVVGALIGAWLTYRFSLQLAEKAQRLDANKKLVHSFSTELADVYPTAVNWPDDISSYLMARFPALQAAIAEFRFYLPCSEWESFDRVWFEYYCATGREVDRNCQSYVHYMNMTMETNSIETVQDGHANLVNNINRVLNYAKKT